MSLFPPNNALAWAHFRLRGGWVRSLTWTGGSMALIAVVLVSSVRLNPDDATKICFGWASGLLALQGLNLVLFVPGRISNTIRADLQGKMIESHRLMPLPPGHAIAGYVVGAATQPMVFAAATFVMGGIAAGFGSADLGHWVFAHGVLLVFAASAWVICAYVSFGAKLGVGMIFLPLMIPYLSEGGVLSLLPGLTVMLSPLIGRSIFDLRNVGMQLPPTYAIAFAAQAAVAALCFIAAARKYRSAAAIGTDTVVGLAFVIVWAAASFAGLRQWEDFRPRGWSPVRLPTEAQILGSIVAGMLVAMSPMAANANERVRFRRHESIADPAPIARPWSLMAVLLIATAAILVIPYAPTGADRLPIPAGLLGQTAAVVLIFLAGVYFLFDWAYATWNGRAGWLLFTWLLLTWGGPIAIDLMRYGLAESGEIEPIAGVASCSPPGALIVLWTGRPVNAMPGIVMQALIALIPASLWTMSRMRGRRETSSSLGVREGAAGAAPASPFAR